MLSEALAELGSRSIGVVVTELLMPGTNGFELLAFLHRARQRTPAIAINGHMTAAEREKALRLGAYWCFAKPLPVQELAEAVSGLLASGPVSVVRGISVPGVLQLLEIEKKTCTLTIRADEVVGRLFLARGRLKHAICGPLQGVEAAHRLVGLGDAEVEIAHVLASNEQTIDQSVSTLLLDAFRVADEANRIADDDPSSRLSPHPPGSAPLLSRIVEDLAPLGGSSAAGVYSPRSGLFVRHGDAAAVDNELCALFNAAIAGLSGHLSERGWGVIHETDILTSDGWLVCARSVPSRHGFILFAAFRHPSNLGLLALRLKEVIGRITWETERDFTA